MNLLYRWIGNIFIRAAPAQTGTGACTPAGEARPIEWPIGLQARHPWHVCDIVFSIEDLIPNLIETERSGAGAVDARQPWQQLAPLDGDLRRSLRDHVHLVLRMAIISGKFEENQKLNERQLAAELGVSTTPLKEAFRQLEAEGLVETLPRRGVRSSFGKAWAEEMILARAALESTIASLAAKRIDEDQKEGLRAVTRLMQAATQASDVDELLRLNSRFHDAIHDASGCQHLTRLIKRQAFYDEGARRIIHSDRAEGAMASKEHMGIGKAICREDPEAAEKLMREHVLRSGARYIAVVFPDGPEA